MTFCEIPNFFCYTSSVKLNLQRKCGAILQQINELNLYPVPTTVQQVDQKWMSIFLTKITYFQVALLAAWPILMELY